MRIFRKKHKEEQQFKLSDIAVTLPVENLTPTDPGFTKGFEEDYESCVKKEEQFLKDLNVDDLSEDIRLPGFKARAEVEKATQLKSLLDRTCLAMDLSNEEFGEVITALKRKDELLQKKSDAEKELLELESKKEKIGHRKGGEK